VIVKTALNVQGFPLVGNCALAATHAGARWQSTGESRRPNPLFVECGRESPRGRPHISR